MGAISQHVTHTHDAAVNGFVFCVRRTEEKYCRLSEDSANELALSAKRFEKKEKRSVGWARGLEVLFTPDE